MAKQPILHEAVIPSLVRAMRDDPDERMRAAAASELGHFRAPAAAAAVVEAALWNDPADGLGRRAVRAAQRFPAGSVLSLLVRGLGDPKTRSNAAAVLVGLGPQARKAGPALKRAYAAEKRPEVQAALRRALEGADKGWLAESLVRDVDDPDRGVRSRSMQELGSLGLKAPKSAVPTLTRAMRQNADPVKRLDAAILLNQWKNEEAGFVLFGLMNDARLGELDRFRAALALSESGDKTAVAVFVRLLSGGDAAVKKWAAGVLGKLRTKESIPALAEASKSEDLEVCAAASGALVRLGAPEALPGLLRMLKAPKTLRLQAPAIGLLGELGPAAAGAVPALKKVLADDESEDARRSAGRALVRISPREAAAALAEASRLWKNRSLKKDFDRMRREAE
jgi:HEAT repeat protein